MAHGKIRLAAMADLHYGVNAQGKYASAFAHASEQADVLLLCGDLADHGLTSECRALVTDLQSVARRIPILAVLGNHEFESGQPHEVSRIFSDGGIRVLDGHACEIDGIGFVGAKGFAGGFDDYKLEPWGENTVKAFVREAENEAMKLETALGKLDTLQRVVLLHYAPIAATAVGEPPEIFPFLGSSRLEWPLNRHAVTAVFHGHAHRGSVEGRTRTGIPVYNVAVGLLERTYPDRPPYRALELVAERVR
jgi:Icc-related predicted phosphoesterase